jgi:steroid 5-alpha reductase family enzyme
MLGAAVKDCAAGGRDKRHSAGNRKMENVWDATKLMLIVYGMAAVVSFLVAWVIKLTFVAIRMQGARGKAPAEAPAKRPAAPAQAGPENRA